MADQKTAIVHLKGNRPANRGLDSSQRRTRADINALQFEFGRGDVLDVPIGEDFVVTEADGKRLQEATLPEGYSWGEPKYPTSLAPVGSRGDALRGFLPVEEATTAPTPPEGDAQNASGSVADAEGATGTSTPATPTTPTAGAPAATGGRSGTGGGGPAIISSSNQA